MSIFDFDNYTDFVSDVGDSIWDVATSIADAHKLIGNLLKTVSPIIAFFPGIGTGIAVAIYAAGAAAAEDKLSDAVIGTVTAALPPGLPRIAFTGGANIVAAVADGNNVLDVTIDSCRNAASTAGPAARAAFDAGVTVAKGGAVDQRAIDAGRDFALRTGGQAAAASFDAGVGIIRGQSSDQVLLEVTRNYVRDMGGASAAAVFDTGVALAYGKTLQEAGYSGLKAFVKGNNPVEQMILFVETVGRANSAGIALEQLLSNDLVRDFMGAIGDKGLSAVEVVKEKLKPLTDAIGDNADILNFSPGDLAQQWGIDEVFIRAAQAILRNGEYDQVLMRQIFNAAQHQETLARIAEAAKGKESLDLNRAGASVMSESGLAKEAAKAASIAATLAPQTSLSMGDMMTAKTSLSLDSAYNAAQSQALTAKQNEAFAAKGVELLKGDARLAAGRKTYDNGDFRRGFDVAIGACSGMTMPGPGQTRIRNSLSDGSNDPGMLFMGFDIGQALAHGIAKQNLALKALSAVSPDPFIAAGQLATNGLIGSGASLGQKEAIVGALAQNPSVRSGIESAAAEKKGFFAKLKEFFGFGS